RMYPDFVALDFKGDFQPLLERPVIVHDPRDARLAKPGQVIFRPSPEYRSRRWLEYFFARLIARAQRRRPFVVYVDEGLTLGHLRAVSNLAILTSIGRSLNCGVWLGSQRLAWIPVELRTEAWRWWIFYLADPEDEKLVLRHAKGQLTLEELRAHAHTFRFFELRRGAESGGQLRVTAFGKVKRTHSQASRR
ncbi:MAG: hypothetical protein ACRDFX_09695, partial [Chloroflexota bacterium]